MTTEVTNNVTDTALIFEGGGMRGSFSSGVLVTLLEAGIHADWVGGISAGTSCLANYVSRDPARAERSFVDFAAEPEFGDWRTWLQGKGMFNAEWIYEQTALPHQAMPFDFDAFSANPARLALGAYRCEDGEMVYWGRDDVAELPALMKRVRASSTMPLLMPLTTIDGVDYCDGALGPTGGFAHDAAKEAGFERFLVVMTRERGYRKRTSRLSSAYRSLFRRYPAVARGILERPANYNRSLDDLLDLEREGRAFLIFPDEMPIKNSERDLTRLRGVFDAGRRQAMRQLPQIRDFLGLN
ncbi:patatin family protein [Tessaracoccus aquimaris]|uniref:Patatin family protein n=1 Tax=Tessaracoccus aquimaris TaxID=1332264 RepID=A0A1Q2CKA9_9ACTN|nr:patatin family protein [Tessaracoccus aquimaris]AQP46547.1 patatin family protein [Tessaracoccus aquimaris]